VITLVPLTGFLGSGKTTTLISAAIAMQRTGRRVAVVTNDHGTDLVDTHLARSGLDEVAEVTRGCFCRRFEDLAALAVGLADSGRADTVLAEATGSCTDLQAAVVRPLRRRHGDRITVAPLTTIVDPLRLAAYLRSADRGEPESDLAYLYGRQLAEADVLALNKIDLIGPEQTARLEARLAVDYPTAVVVPFSATTGAGIDALLRAWRQGPVAVERDVEVDYTRYLDAEAQLAWLNQPVQLNATGDVFDALAWGRAVLRHLSDWSAAAGLQLGHAKVTVRTSAGLAKLSVTEAGAPPRIDRTAARPVTLGSATVNARVVCPPAVLDHAVSAALAAADALSGTRSTAAPPVSFQPGHPRPRQRVAAGT
jgi:Ni2+-binding GTPase involved in maturation of urease and hydrogenase